MNKETLIESIEERIKHLWKERERVDEVYDEMLSRLYQEVIEITGDSEYLGPSTS